MKIAKTDTEKERDNSAKKEIKKAIKLAMVENEVSYSVLAERLTAMGRPIAEQSLRNKISQCSHQTVWYWDLMKAIKENIT